MDGLISGSAIALQKQVAFFLTTEWLPYSCRQTGEAVVMRGSILVLKATCIRQLKVQLPSSSYNHKTSS